MKLRKWSFDELVRFLREHNVPIDSWGKHAAKRVIDLLAELNKGEARLVVRRGRVYRLARTLRMRIESQDPKTLERVVLKEEIQIYPFSPFDDQAAALQLLMIDQEHAPSKTMEPPVRVRYFEYGASASETMMHGEKAITAAYRLLLQELGIPRLQRHLISAWKLAQASAA